MTKWPGWKYWSACVALTCAGFYLGRVTGWDWVDTFIGEWIPSFVKTPGFAGLAALGAATFAWYNGREDRKQRDLHAENERLSHQREVLSAAWWERVQWALTASNSKNSTTRVLSIQMLNALSEKPELDAEDREFVELAYELIVEEGAEFEFDFPPAPGPTSALDDNMDR